MLDHNESHESPPHRDRPNLSPWGGDAVEEDEGRPCGSPDAVDRHAPSTRSP